MHQATRCATALLVGVLTLTGCSGRDDEPQSEPAPSEPAESSSEPTDETPDAPELPPEAAENTSAGSERFALFYVDVMNYARASGDSAPLLGYATSECAVCGGYATAAEEGVAEGVSVEGGNFSVKETDSLVADYGTSGGTYVVLEIAEQIVTHPDGTVDEYEVRAYPIGIYPIWTDDGWRVQWISVPD